MDEIQTNLKVIKESFREIVFCYQEMFRYATSLEDLIQDLDDQLDDMETEIKELGGGE
jgi:hypothetical protein